MRNCRYCSILENGDIPETTKDVLAINLFHGLINMRIGNNGEDGFGMIITNKETEEMIDKPLKFKYCPMCGLNIGDVRRRVKE